MKRVRTADPSSDGSTSTAIVTTSATARMLENRAWSVPTDVMIHIYSFLSWKDVTSAKVVSRFFNRCMLSEQYEVLHCIPAHQKAMALVAQQYRVCKLSDEDLVERISPIVRFRAQENITVDRGVMESSLPTTALHPLAMMVYFFTPLHPLRELYLSDTVPPIKEDAFALPTLTLLSIKRFNLPGQDETRWIHFFRGCTTIQNLKIEGFMCHENASVITNLSLFVHLNSLSLRFFWFDKIPVAFYLNSPSGLIMRSFNNFIGITPPPHLRRLTIDGGYKEIAETPSSFLSSLTHLTLEMSTEAEPFFARNCPNIASYVIKNNLHVSGPFSRFSNKLYCLQLEGSTLASASIFDSFASNLLGLKELKLVSIAAFNLSLPLPLSHPTLENITYTHFIAGRFSIQFQSKFSFAPHCKVGFSDFLHFTLRRNREGKWWFSTFKTPTWEKKDEWTEIDSTASVTLIAVTQPPPIVEPDSSDDEPENAS